MRADATVVQIDLDYRNVGKNRDISLGLVGDCGAILKAVAQAATGRASKGNAQRAEWMKELRAAEAKAYEKLLPSFKSESMPINPYRVAYEINEFLTDNTVYIGDGGDVVTITATAVEPRKAGNWMDPGRSAPWASALRSRWRPSSSIRKKKCCATTATAPSA